MTAISDVKQRSFFERDDAMAKTVTASQQMMTDGQIDNVVDKFRAALCQHRREFLFDAVQRLLGAENLGMECLTPFCALVEAQSDFIFRRVKVDRSRTPQAVLNATGRNQYINKDVVNVIPKGEGEEVEVIFFNLDRPVSDADLAKEYDFRGLKPADPYSLAAVNEADPAFADQQPNTTHWKDSAGKWCYAVFNQWRSGERHVHVYRYGTGWHGTWWFAGVRK